MLSSECEFEVFFILVLLLRLARVFPTPWSSFEKVFLRLPVLLSSVPALLTDSEKSKALSSLPGLFEEVLCVSSNDTEVELLV